MEFGTRALAETGAMLNIVQRFHDVIELFDSLESVSQAVAAVCKLAGFRYFAIAHHDHWQPDRGEVLRVHNYPADWAAWFDAHGLGSRDPVHRASQSRNSGFGWWTLDHLIDLTPDDHKVRAMAQDAGIGDGYTVPYHVPGERSGSCSFAVEPGVRFPRDQIPLAQALGSFAFEAARNLVAAPPSRRRRAVRLTQREREIVVCLGQGKQEKEIARHLDISPTTVNAHLKNARTRYGISKSSPLVVWGLFTGSITYGEILDGASTHA